MASACVNKIGMSPENFLDCPPTAAAAASKYSSFGWLSNPRISFSREIPDEEPAPPPPSKPSLLPISPSTGLVAKQQQQKKPEKKNKNNAANSESKKELSDPGSPGNDFVDFEFRLEDPVNMLPADELFSDGKLVPMQLPSAIRHSTSSSDTVAASLEVQSPPDTPKFRHRGEISSTDPYLFSPKAPRCSSRWKEILGLKKLYQNSNKQQQQQQEAHKTTSSTSTHRSSFKHLLHRNSKSSSLLSSSLDSSSSLSLPLLRDGGGSGGDSESVSISSSRLSLSSSSSGHEHDDLPRLSLDSDRPASASSSRASLHVSGANVSLHRLRVAKSRALSAENAAQMRMGRSPIRKPVPEPSIRGVSVDSPRMNSSGKIVFHSLERSSSSPSSFNGGPRYKYRGMERSYSANVRVTPVLNVPVCSSLRSSSKSGGGVFGFPLFSSPSSQPRKESNGGGGGGGGVKSRSDRN
ncbi:OLC1v1022305C1 [Oldenlandia corymbosa var. corymbosa]|uniref:OLC1v1022305C1 n=1 Tax=Oldenlandia corymbosa var. corymbosa TaxID=529605 RepID=A0AAV1BY89_OLDCO|nr:OLC1v1022305C1 [Oldenlandia corymbosa var. corymbosa]